MNFFSHKKPKPQFSLKPIENSNLFQRRTSNINCHIDNHEISQQTHFNNQLNHEDKNDKCTNTVTSKSADNSPVKSQRLQTFAEATRNMETNLGKAVKFEVSRGLVP